MVSLQAYRVYPTYQSHETYARDNPNRSYSGRDGRIYADFLSKSVPYHIAVVNEYDVPDMLCHELARFSCGMALRTADVIRGRLKTDNMRRTATVPCLKKLNLMASLVDSHMMNDLDEKRRFFVMPAVPRWVNGMIVGPQNMEASVQLTIGREWFLVNLHLTEMGSIWKCTFADMG